MRQITFVFNAGEQNGIHTFLCGGLALDLTKEDYKNFEENHLDENAIKAMAFSFLTKQLFQDFSTNDAMGE